MILLEKLKGRGWYLTEEGLKKLTGVNGAQTDDVDGIISLALDWDLRDIAAGALPPKPDSNGTISGGIVLQLQKMRNISAPKANEDSSVAPRFLQLELSDGLNTVAALEFERIANLNMNVPPGTKLFIKTEKLKLLNGFIALKSSDVQILGGKVEALVEKWELARQMLKYAKSNRRPSGSGGPPPWIAFGKHLDDHKAVLPMEKNFKSLQIANEKEKNSKENEEFIASRSQAIAEATKTGQKKVFGGGHVNILDHNVKKILEKGYAEEEAEQALKITKNNLEKALYNLKRRKNRSCSTELIAKSVSASVGGRVKERAGIPSNKEEAVAGKPQTNVSLFDFLTNKLSTQTKPSSIDVHAETEDNNLSNVQNTRDNSLKTSVAKDKCNKFENNMSSSFAANKVIASAKHECRQTNESCSHIFNRKQEERNQQFGKKIGNDGKRYNLNKKKTQTPVSNKAVNVINLNLRSIAKNTKRNEVFTREKEPKDRRSINNYQASKCSNDNKIEKKSNQSMTGKQNNQGLRGKNKNCNQKPAQKLNHFEKDWDNLVQSASNLAIQNKTDLSANIPQNRNGNNQPKNNKTQQQKSENNQNAFSQEVLDSCSPQLENGYVYDPTKIMGFQNKETNEYAMNMLKSQGVAMQQFQDHETASSNTQQIVPLLPPLVQHSPHTQIPNNQNSVTVAHMTQNRKAFVAQPQQVPQRFGMMCFEDWPWKEGDLCLAKYWEDGSYYNAKITAVSEKTCVVLFLGYGNHEEVLKSDCLPITDAQHVPLNAYQGNISASPAFQQKPILNSSEISGGVGSQRYRGERQMYVPPHKRATN